ncbi:EAL and HDOD domain-containing protein [Gynuella sunshinyii]|uniref:Putative signal transduction protein containing EAL and modified HD-GYP domain n=1 Tax=Gynuella sunshinyii YC6258 TaxID=1445510 RepID=A0A0C5VNM2_9GAMM|nr:HDOD domain-containing protein [Gynuella sunshinyii]AJQ96262.1 putative signal transduction protein containing EAL and modified HD-GYP domain [Gynuella sunshinyii YC6258]
MTETVLFARQPILNRKQEVIAYELLFRDDVQTERAVIESDEKATSSVIINAFTSMQMSSVTNNKLAFINFPASMLKNMPDLSPDSVVLELLETIHYTPDVLEDVIELKKRGFRIALDDFLFKADSKKIVRYADIIKLDIQQINKNGQRKCMDIMAKLDVDFLAEKVETERQFIDCMSMNYKYFQGFFFSKPDLIKGHALAPDKWVVLELITELNQKELDIKKLYEIISRDSILSYKLLRLINSSFYRRAKEIESLHHGIVMLGVEKIKNWANVVALTQLETSSEALRHLALERARFSENLAFAVKGADPQIAFTVGLFSCLDAFTLKPLQELLTDLPLHESIKEALLHHRGVYGYLLHAIKAHERALWGKIKWQALGKVGLTEEVFEQAYQDALMLADGIVPILTERVDLPHSSNQVN